MPSATLRLVGHGLVVVPHAGYHLERVDGAPATTLRVSIGAKRADVDLRAALATPSALVDVTEGAHAGAWRVQTSVFTCAWPAGFALADDGGPSPVLFVGPGSAAAWIDGPLPRAKTSPIENLVDAGQTVRAVAQQGDNQRLDLEYEHDGERWWQRRYALVWGREDSLVVSAQALLDDEPAARAAVDELATTIEPYRPA